MRKSITKGCEVAAKNWQLALIVYGVSVVTGFLNLPFADLMSVEAFGAVPAVAGGKIALFILLLIVSVLVNMFVMGGVLGSIKSAIATGKAQMGEFVGLGKKYFVRLLLMALLSIAIYLVAGFLIASVNGAFEIVMAPFARFVLGLLMIGLSLGAVILGVVLAFWAYALVGDDLGVMDGLKQSVKVATSPKINIVFVLLLLLALVLTVFIVTFVFALPAGAMGMPMGNIYGILVIGAVRAFLIIFFHSLMMTFYYTLKLRGDEVKGGREGSPA